MPLSDITNGGARLAPATKPSWSNREVTPQPDEHGENNASIFSPVSRSGKSRDMSGGGGREALCGREFLVTLGMRVRLTEDESDEFKEQSGGGAGKVVSVDNDGNSCRVLWDATGLECAYPTGECSFYFLRRESLADPTHGLGEVQFSLPSLMIHKAASSEPVSMSLAPKPVMMEADGGDLNRGEEGASNQFRLGMRYLQGQNCQQDTAKAVNFFAAAASAGDANAQFNLGVLYTQGIGVPQDHVEAARNFRLSAEQGDPKAQLQLGVCHVLERGVNASYSQAARWFRAAADQGDASAQYNLGVCLAKGRGVAKDAAEAFLCFEAAAKQGDAGAQFRLALAFAAGRGTTKNSARSVEWYREAAAQAHGGALFNLGVCYAQGDGVVRDDKLAVAWYTEAAEGGVMQAQHNLALALLTGTGTPQDEKEALKWYLRAADQGDSKSMFAAGVCFETAQGTELDVHRAANLYKEAAKSENPKATVALGLCYKGGIGVIKNPEKAVQLFKKSAEMGNHRGMWQYSRSLQTGEGLKAADAQASQEWAEKAAANGSTEARRALKLQQATPAPPQAKAPEPQPAAPPPATVAPNATAVEPEVEAEPEVKAPVEVSEEIQAERQEEEEKQEVVLMIMPPSSMELSSPTESGSACDNTNQIADMSCGGFQEESVALDVSGCPPGWGADESEAGSAPRHNARSAAPDVKTPAKVRCGGFGSFFRRGNGKKKN
ncbi:hypothetical protein T484DRAFT_2022248 [Baffinella frigidus]|nr:hypothetical protein T484DRAFT_2022248 [Cryptophyta sp. CCMP2293]|mmetsp:Transcript_47935/g.114112  ORF Transcript_47935/g.114112 Transcript_47935/m.114112 type:complete len:720 (-) Transcript_47935:42-2201(-)